METEFTPLLSLAGGLLVGLAAVALMALHGRILGATGLTSGLLFEDTPDGRKWRGTLLAGMVLGPVIVFAVTGTSIPIQAPGMTALLIGGLLVGFGASYGSGCTSGHGVCGLSRLSLRSIVATGTFMASTAVTVFVVRHLLGG